MRGEAANDRIKNIGEFVEKLWLDKTAIDT